MDTDLLKTFLEINRTRHFGKAADNLFITQSAVSARIRLLEQQLGVPLFTRDRNNIQLTRAGEKLVLAAESIMSMWTRARTEIAIDDDRKLVLSVGAVPGIWDVLLQEWLQEIYVNIPEIILSSEALSNNELMRRIVEHTLDLAFVFDAPTDSDLEIKEYFSADLILVASQPGLSVEEAVSTGFIHVDWGTRVSVMLAKHFPDLPIPRMRTGLGRIAHRFLLAGGGSAYLARTMVDADLRSARLHEVFGAPVLNRTIFAAYRYDNEHRELMETALSVNLPKIATI